ncbi:MAG: hypothetical protein CL433_13185 [Acidimicrobiaceae bacterium]|nr:hypothetical protein [Acidimicrobiaceae bacterium]
MSTPSQPNGALRYAFLLTGSVRRYASELIGRLVPEQDRQGFLEAMETVANDYPWRGDGEPSATATDAVGAATARLCHVVISDGSVLQRSDLDAQLDLDVLRAYVTAVIGRYREDDDEAYRAYVNEMVVAQAEAVVQGDAERAAAAGYLLATLAANP